MVIVIDSELGWEDYTKAFEYYQKAADICDANGAFSASHYYENGIRVEKDSKLALEYYQKATDMVMPISVFITVKRSE